MTKLLPRISNVEIVFHGVLKLVWNDGYIGLADLRPLIEQGKIFTYLQNPTNFNKIQLDDYGHSIGWINDDGDEIDLGADSLRIKAEKSDIALRAVS